MGAILHPYIVIKRRYNYEQILKEANRYDAILEELEKTFSDEELCNMLSEKSEDEYIADNESW